MSTQNEPPPDAIHCIYCKKALCPDAVIRWGFDDIPVCRACYKTLDDIKEDRIAAYRNAAGTRKETGNA